MIKVAVAQGILEIWRWCLGGEEFEEGTEISEVMNQ